MEGAVTVEPPTVGAAMEPVGEAARGASASVRAVVFDLGGVLIDWDPRYLYGTLFDGDDEAMEQFLATVTTPDWNAQQDAGRSFGEAVDELAAQHPHHADLIRAYHVRWREMIGGPIQGTLELLAELRSAGIPLYALTNWSAETFAPTKREFDFLSWFDGIVVSGEERVTKPDERIFRILVDRYGLEPGRTLYIDDSAVNVETARRLGFDTVHFRDPDQLRAELGRRGLPPSTGSVAG